MKHVLRATVTAYLFASVIGVIPAAAQENIGVAAVSRNNVTGEFDTKVRDILVGSQVRKNELITTGRDAGTQILFLDETILTLGPNSSMKLDSLVYDPQDPEVIRELAVGAFSGTMRFISGNSNSEAYRINTPTATIGMRGSAGDIDIEPTTGATTVVLRSGIFTVTSLTNQQTVVLDTVGTSTTVTTAQTPPSTPATPPPPVTTRTQKLDSIATGDTDTGLAPTVTPTTPTTTTTTTDILTNQPAVDVPVDTQTTTETVNNPSTTPTGDNYVPGY